MRERNEFNWESTGPGGCDSHCIEHPCGPCATAAGIRIKPYTQPDIDICRACGEHAEFDENGSNCCGAGAYDTDHDTDMER